MKTARQLAAAPARAPNTRQSLDFLSSAVARRILSLFLVAACVPALLLMLLSYGQVRGVIDENLNKHLAQTGDAYGRGIYEKLYTADVLLRAFTEHGHGVNDAAQAELRGGQGGFRAARMVAGDELAALLDGRAAADLPPIGEAQRAHLVAGHTALLPAPTGATLRMPWLVRALEPADLVRGVIYGQLDDEYFWGDREDYAKQLCVLAPDRSVLRCSTPELAEPAARAQASNLRRGAVADADWSAAVSTLFLKPQYAAGEWTVVTLQPRGVAEALLRGVMRDYLAIGGLTLLLVAWLSVAQIRRTLVPLQHLTEATARYARQQFDEPVRVDSDDEFGELAQAMDGMAQRLSRQIGAMRALSDIDREILSTIDVEQITQRVLAQVAEIVPGCASALVIPGPTPDDAAIARVHGRGAAASHRVYLARTGPLQAHCRSRQWVDCWIELADGEPVDVQARAELLRALDAPGCWLQPVLSRGRHVGTLAVAPAQREQIDHDTARQLHDLGDRVAVALLAREREETLVFRAHHDALTELPNRLLLLERLEHAMAHARRDASQVALLFIDLDRFKVINDDMGHDAGDQVLRAVAERLLACVRETDTVARLGGDEFVVMLTAVHSSQDAAHVAAQIQDALGKAFVLGSSEYRIGASVGVAMFPSDGDAAQDLLNHADTAMYRAKGEGRGSIVFFEESMNTQQHERAIMERELRLALVREQMQVHYQPRVDLRSGKVVSVEALVRWTHPLWGAVPPARFIPLAESVGLIESIGNWVLHQACAQLAAWHEEGLDIERVSVNVSGRQLKTSALPRIVRRALDATGLAASALELEVTESVLVDDAEGAIAQLAALRETGVTIALDDFGTGYSSMSYLRRMPIDVLKIDRSFVKDIEHDESVRRIALAIISMAQALHLSVTAEGVETLRQAELLRGWQCGEAQGYYFARPLEPDALATLLRKGLLPSLAPEVEAVTS